MSDRYVSETVVCRLLRRRGFEIDHCDSCHEDQDEWGYEMIEIDLGNGRRTEVCCRVSEIWENMKDECE